MDENRYTSLVDSQRLAEIGFEAEADGYWEIINKDRYDAREPTLLRGVVLPGDAKYRKALDRKIHTVEYIPAFRLDTLLLELPEWIFEPTEERLNFLAKTSPLETEIFLNFLEQFRGQEAIAACVDLLCLLRKEQVKEGV